MRRPSLLLLSCVLVLPVAISVGSTGASAGTASHPPRPTAPKHLPATPHEGSALRAAIARGTAQRNATTRLDPALQSAAKSGKAAEVDVYGDTTKAAAAVRRAGGVVKAQIAGAMTALVPGDKLATLAAATGVLNVLKPIHPVEYATTSQGVAASGADVWQTAHVDGTGVTVAIIDGAFKSLNLPSGTFTEIDTYCANPQADTHGSAVAEIVHQMAPGAHLLLYCVDTPIEVNSAEQAARTAGAKIISSSLGWPGDSRGDGTARTGSVAAAVADARQHGVLWINSAGNQGQDHWQGAMADKDRDQLVDVNGPGTTNDISNERDSDFVAPGGPAGVVLTWDQWPNSTLGVRLYLFQWQCLDSACSSIAPVNTDGQGNPVPYVVTAQTSAPEIDADLTNTSSGVQLWDAYVYVPTPQPSVHYDLTWEGDVAPSYLATVNPARAASGSIDDVAASPYAMAVGAVDASAANACQSDAQTVGGWPFEAFSSQGPTLDGRPKPDIAGYDGTASNVLGQPFCGTSASAPHVAGAAALVAQENPNLDAAQLQSLLEQRANHGAPINPAGNQVGHGVLTLGAVDGAAAPAGSTFTALPAPVRVLDTRNGTGAGGHAAPIGALQTIAVTIPTTVVPAGATAVSLNVTGTFDPGQKSSGFLSVFPGGAAWPGTSNVNLATPTDAPAAASTIATLGPGGVLEVRNGGGTTVEAILDVTGYFMPGTAANTYTALSPPVRAYDGQSGNHVLNPHQSLVITPAVPTSATAVLINLTAASPTGSGFFNAAPSASIASSSLNFVAGQNRANMAIVGLNSAHAFTIETGGLHGAIPVVDIVGYFSASGGASYVPLPSPVRVMDTRIGDGGRKSPLGAKTYDPLFVAGLNGVPYTATAVATNVTVVDHTGSTFVTAFPAGLPLPPTSTVNVTAPRVVPNGAVIGTNSKEIEFYNAGGSVDIITDLFGYFS